MPRRIVDVLLPVALDQVDIHVPQREREGEHDAPDARRDVLLGRHAPRMV